MVRDYANILGYALGALEVRDQIAAAVPYGAAVLTAYQTGSALYSGGRSIVRGVRAMARRRKRRRAAVGAGAGVRRVRRRMNPHAVIPFNRGYVRQAGLYGRFGGNKELKFFDLESFATTTSIGVTTHSTMIQVPQGTGESQRIGRKIFLQSLELKLYLKLFSVSGTVGVVGPVANQYRVVVVQDKQCNGSTTSWTSVFEETHLLARRRIENEMRYRILLDEIVSLIPPGIGSNGTDAVTPNVERVKLWMLNLKMPIEFDGTAGTIGERRSNNLTLLTYSDRTHATLWNLRTRIRYLD